MEVSRESTLHSCFKISDFASASRWSLCSSRTNLAASSDQRTWIKFGLFLELVDVLRKRHLFRKVFIDSTFSCVRTLRQVSLHFLGSEMNLTLSFLRRNDKLVIGRHLLLSPVSTVVKPAYSVFAYHPNPIQVARVAMHSAESEVDVILGLWKNIGLTSIELSSSVSFLGS